MKHLLLAAALLLPFAAQAQPKPTHCFNTSIRDVDAAGTQLSIDAGWVLDVYPGEDPAVKFWDPQDKLQVCALGGAAYQVTNLQRNNHVDALRRF
jgi:hypothetical protein